MASQLKSYLDSFAIWQRDESKPAKSGAKPGVKKVNLALQGGGAHGAFTWGVIDGLLADGRIEVTGVSGASAGAVNAVMLADGLVAGGTDEARKRLADFWRAASTGGNLPPLQRSVLDRLLSLIPLTPSPVESWVTAWSRYLSPYDINPLNINPLKELIEKYVDFARVQESPLELFIAATNVHTGRLRIFSGDKINADVVMASAALPFLFRAVEIDGIPYWDGGYMGNPPIFPFLRCTDSEDVIVVQINPVSRDTTPRSSADIFNRLNEITFNSTLISEFRAIDFVNQLIEDGHLPHGRGKNDYRRLNVHRIELGTIGQHISAASRLSTDYAFLDLLFRAGVRAAERFLEDHFDDIGKRSTINLEEEAGVEWA